MVSFHFIFMTPLLQQNKMRHRALILFNLKSVRSAIAARPRRPLVLTHHKCASTFVGIYLNKVCDLNDLRMFRSNLGTARPEFDLSLLTNATYRQIEDAIDGPAIHIIRNPLDIVVSAYYSHRSTHHLGGWPHLSDQRAILTRCSKEAGLFLTLAFLEQAEFYRDTPGPLHALRQWNFDDRRIRTVRMEDLVTDVGSLLGETLGSSMPAGVDLPAPEDFTFERITGGRRAGEVDEASHYRSGRPGSWRDELPEPIIAYVRAHFRDLLQRYYPDALE
jgi:hypothetical protein